MPRKPNHQNTASTAKPAARTKKTASSKSGRASTKKSTEMTASTSHLVAANTAVNSGGVFSMLHVLATVHALTADTAAVPASTLTWEEQFAQDKAILSSMATRLKKGWPHVFEKVALNGTFKKDYGMDLLSFEIFIAGVRDDLANSVPPYRFDPAKKIGGLDLYQRNFTRNGFDTAADISTNIE
ncbi:hypothetical protein DFR29_103321 [Tahibacter aquaticus]|uniref:Uncharacterized protein n=1 Tax=Tahibacter aquaticus TaxID=520092 RepID=A0A4R6Z514_9GAMM|nr:hypothetical protein [Tahibacter aquaticus]TDR46785.1 hypothetical protein DFR29_103321 [Tahibacter aquaticus]